MLYKRYIPVITLMDENGEITPISIIWDDYQGKKTYNIDRIVNVKKLNLNIDSNIIKFECIIYGKQRKLFYENNRWFVEQYISEYNY